MTFLANAHRLGWASDAQVKRARELGKVVIMNDADRTYFKNLVTSGKWASEVYLDILGEEYKI